ncbi:hypothetical protein HYDPIDRAFT_171200 [Hydnomerulius pinastri MD-312]|uniref:Protein-serine/threonine kinase n=1 Tax=Hydnomerulius pinastri MD-312 TaxID=994086 RepID=A0A0C9W769_9AGAM|nr:hypothetical protein HYDPIDRAFT_171200 [Hydnomerulius pinastri MD-312]
MSISLPESVPNPPLVSSFMEGDADESMGGLGHAYGEKEGDVYGSGKVGYNESGTGNANANWNAMCGVRNGNVKLRAPVGRRYYAQTPTHTYSPKSTTTILASSGPSMLSNDGMTPPSPESRRVWRRGGAGLAGSVLLVYVDNRGSVFDWAICSTQHACRNHPHACQRPLFRGPPIQLICPPDLTFADVPGHLSHIVFELLKNSLRAVAE